jgi:hypothetical protein
MDKVLRRLALFVFAMAAAFGFAVYVSAADLTDSDKQFLSGYEKVRAALAADNLAEAKTAAGEMGEEGAAIAKSESIITARKEFAPMSERAINLSKGQQGFYVVNCPMLKKDWVQTSTKISNPYAGKEMLTCGVVKP